MPELPEVEIVRRQLESSLVGRIFREIIVSEPYSVIISGRRSDNALDAQKQLKSVFSEKELKSIQRKGKILILDFGDVFLVVHLKMTGRLLLEDPFSPPKKYERLRILFSGNIALVFEDKRKFGYFRVLPSIESLRKRLKNYGPDALKDLSSEKELRKLLKTRKKAIKRVLVDQNILSGIGNAYADEILFEARINPFRRASELSDSEVKRLFLAIKKKLEEGIRTGGLTLRDYVDSHGKRGSFQEGLKVYGREGKGCIHCGKVISREKSGGRSTYFCQRCQK